MKIRRYTPVIVLFLMVAALAVPASARGKKNPANTEPGTYKEWGPDIDQIEVVQTFKFGDYSKVVVAPIDTSGADTKDKAVATAVENATNDFAEQLGKDVKTPVTVDEQPKKSADTLLVRMKVTGMDPGSRAARYWASFGAGAAVAKMDGEIVDAKTNKVLARFTQERRSGFGVAGGSSEALLRRDVRAIATDVANILKAF
ncbi:MAG TPA: DUF4410 domain-containing protein [Thermoanaerobaculia bacterium]|nr:DUF4410 domain-containing protein [Thermoanaerobaculia bacterium]